MSLLNKYFFGNLADDGHLSIQVDFFDDLFLISDLYYFLSDFRNGVESKRFYGCMERDFNSNLDRLLGLCVEGLNSLNNFDIFGYFEYFYLGLDLLDDLFIFVHFDDHLLDDWDLSNNLHYLLLDSVLVLDGRLLYDSFNLHLPLDLNSFVDNLCILGV